MKNVMYAKTDGKQKFKIKNLWPKQQQQRVFSNRRKLNNQENKYNYSCKISYSISTKLMII